MKKIIDLIKEKTRPDESVKKEIENFTRKINLLLEKNKVKATCVSGGSIAKGTFIKDDFDADLFVRFDYKTYKDLDLSNILEKVISKLKPDRVHGSRDYFQINDKKTDILFEIVPVLAIKDYKQAANVTDMSPLHVGYVKKKLKKGQADEIRVAKMFCKSAKVYGAESYIKGFSGHILDLLIIYYKNFEQLLMQASIWGDKVVIDIEKHLKDPIAELEESKTYSPLVIVDPMQPDRNAAAALSKEKFEDFKKNAKKFLQKPSEEFFKVKKLTKKDLKMKEDEELFYLEVKPLKGKRDVIGSKIMKAYEHMKAEIKKNEFKFKSGWEFDGIGKIYFIVKKEQLPKEIIFKGPPTKMKDGVKSFKKKHKKTFAKNNIMFAEEKRKYRHVEKLIKDLIKDSYVKERVKSISLK